jgi:nucleotide-binding universal stress UspA family protein
VAKRDRAPLLSSRVVDGAAVWHEVFKSSAGMEAPMQNIARILVPIDFSPCSLAALDHAMLLAERFGASIEVLHVWEPPPYGARFGVAPGLDLYGAQPLLEEFAHTDGGKRMEELLRALEERFIKVRGRLASGDPCDTILELVRHDDYDLVVMGTHGRTGIARLLSSSIAERVVRFCTCPVLTVRSQATEPSTLMGGVHS